MITVFVLFSFVIILPSIKLSTSFERKLIF